MKNYMTEEQLKSNVTLGKAVEQWLGYTKEEDYVVIKWLRIDKEKNQSYTVAYFECFDEGNSEFLDVYEFSQLDPDEPYGALNTFDSIDDALIFSTVTYNALNIKYVSAGMIQEEYRDYLDKEKQ